MIYKEEVWTTNDLLNSSKVSLLANDTVKSTDLREREKRSEISSWFRQETRHGHVVVNNIRITIPDTHKDSDHYHSQLTSPANSHRRQGSLVQT